MPAVKVYVKKRLELGRLTIPQKDMAVLGLAAVRVVKARIAKGQGPNDGPARPLSPRWAKIKRRLGLNPIRDLRGTGQANSKQFVTGKKARKAGIRFVGHMIDNFSLRTVTDNKFKAGLSQFAARKKGEGNQQREPWMVFSPSNKKEMITAAQRTLIEQKKKLVIQK